MLQHQECETDITGRLLHVEKTTGLAIRIFHTADLLKAGQTRLEGGREYSRHGYLVQRAH